VLDGRLLQLPPPGGLQGLSDAGLDVFDAFPAAAKAAWRRERDAVGLDFDLPALVAQVGYQ
jgi:hypothetical protein